MDVASVGAIFGQLNKHNLHLLESVYHQNVVFEDAAHRLEGWGQLSDYFSTLYANVIRCHFDITDHQQVNQSGFLIWTMTLAHPKLQNGREVTVNGVTHLRFEEGRVIYHRDYFDLGEMLYENLPLLGSIIKAIKHRLGR